MAIAASLAVGALASASGAEAGTYLLTFSGTDFTSGPVNVWITTTPALSGHVGYSGGPDQLWGEETISGYSGWLDMYVGGEAIGFEGSASAPFDGGAASGLYLTSSSSMFTLTSSTNPTSSGSFILSFPEVEGGGPTIFDLTNSGWNGCCAAPGAGNTDYLSITAVPEPALWAMMLAGFGALGFMMRGSRRKQFSVGVTA